MVLRALRKVVVKLVAPFGTGHIAVRTLSAQTRSPNDLASLAMMAAGNGNWTEAARRWCDCLDQAGGKVQANWLEGYVQALIALERLDDAGLICNRLSYEFANAPESAVCLARLATKLSNWHSADRHWRDASNLLGERIDPSLLREHAGVLAKLGRFHEAETICRSVLARNRTDPLAAAALARIAAQRGSFREAIDLWHTILDQNKRRTRPNWWWELARCHMALQQWHQADEIFDELINCWPEFLNGYEGRARCAMKQQNWAEAARRWRDTLTRFEGRCSPASRGDLGLSLLNLNRLDAAQKVYRDLADEFSDQPVGHAGLANVAARRNDWRTSVDCWRSATTATGGKVHDGNLVAYARALRSIGMFERSDGILQEIIDRRPEWEMGWIELAKNAMVERKMDLAAERWEAIALRFRRHAYHDVSYEQHRAGMFDGGIEIEERPRKRVDTPDDAIQHIANVRTFRAGLIPFLATQTYARRFPDSEFIQISAMQEMKVNIRTASDLDRYLNMSAELCNRFPDSRRLAIFRGMALVAADRVDEVQANVRYIESRFGRCGLVDELSAWVAQATGDLAGAKKIWAQRLNEEFRHSFHTPIRNFRQIDNNDRPILQDRIILFASIRNEIELLPWFFDYYRSIGVDWFFVVDNNSSDGSADYACRQDDATVFWTDDNFYAASSGMRWINELIDRFGRDNWCIFVDTDEQLVVAEVESGGLRAAVDRMRKSGDEVMFGFMLDMYPDEHVAGTALTPGVDPLQLSPYFDADYFMFGGRLSPYVEIVGGAREKLYSTFEVLYKAPIIDGSSGVRYLDNHTTTAAKVGREGCALLHFKILREFEEVRETGARARQERVLDRGPLCRLRYGRYNSARQGAGLRGGLAESKLKYATSNTLLQVGLVGTAAVVSEHGLTIRTGDFAVGVKPASLLPTPLLVEGEANFGECIALIERIECLPDNPAFYVALAHAASLREDWETAIDRWALCFEKYSHTVQPNWEASYAHCLLGANRYEEAGEIFRRLASIEPPGLDIRIGLRRSMIGAGRAAELIDEYRRGLLMIDRCEVDDLEIIADLLRGNELKAAQRIFRILEPTLFTAPAFARALRMIPQLFDGAERRLAWDRYEDLMARADGRNSNYADRDHYRVLRWNLALARQDYQAFQNNVAEIVNLPGPQGEVSYLRQVANKFANPSGDRAGDGKVFGIGLSKTGTRSLATALEILGYTAIHYANPLTGILIGPQDYGLFDAFADTPVAYRFEELIAKYPKAKFIFTTRPIDSWEPSFINHIGHYHGARDFRAFVALVRDPSGCIHGEYFRRIHEELYCRHGDPRAAYQAHDARVRYAFSGVMQDQFLEFDVFSGDSWEKLCDFLGNPVPEAEFPWRNKAAAIGA